MLGYTEDGWNKVRAEKQLSDQLEVVNDTAPPTEKTTPSPKPTMAPTPAPTQKKQQQAVAKPVPVTPAPTLKLTRKPTPSPTPRPTVAPVPYNDDFVLLTREEYFDDDIVVSVGGFVDIAMTQIYLLIASFCFFIFGALNWVRDEQVFHVCMVQGAFFMMISAVFVGVSEGYAVIFHSLAYHCFFLEGVYMLQLRKRIRPLAGLDTLALALWLADGLFGAGAVLDVVVDYWQFMDFSAEYDMNLASAKVLSAGLWFVSAIITFLSTIVLSRKRIFDDDCDKSNQHTVQTDSLL